MKRVCEGSVAMTRLEKQGAETGMQRFCSGAVAG